jgi:hypothetical protein
VAPNTPSTAPTFGYQQSVLNPSTGLFYYVSSSNTVSVIGTGANVLSPGVERKVAVIPVGAAHAGGSLITLIADPTRNLIYANNYYDGNLYVIDGAPNQSVSPTAFQVIASVPLKNLDAYLLAIDTALNRVYVAGPNAVSVSVVQGGTTPQLLENIGYPADFIASLGVDPGTHTVYAVSKSGAGYYGQQESLITLSYTAANQSPSASNQPFPTNETIFSPDFIANSLSVDPQSDRCLRRALLRSTLSGRPTKQRISTNSHLTLRESRRCSLIRPSRPHWTLQTGPSTSPTHFQAARLRMPR